MKARRTFAAGLEVLCLILGFAVVTAAQDAPAPARTAAVVNASGGSTADGPGARPAAAASGAAVGSQTEKIGPAEHKRLLKEAIAQLQASDSVQIQQAIAALRDLEGREAALAIMARVRKGLPPQLTELAVEVLGGLNQPSVTPVLVELTLHRRWQIRERAVVALGALKMRTAVSTLLYALDDPSAEVRSAAALALGRLGDPRALPALAAALEHGVDGAMLALAQLGNARHVELILKFATKDVRASEASLRTLLTRPNLHISAKLEIVQTIRGLAGPDAEAVIASWRGALGKGADPRLLAALGAREAKS